jgi:hypothetical protein
MATPSKSSKGTTRQARKGRQAPQRSINFGLILAGLAAVLVIAGLALVGSLAGSGTGTANPTSPTPSSSVAIVRAGTPAPFGTPDTEIGGPEPPVITPAELKAQLDRGEPVVIVDGRSPTDFAQGHLQGALSIPVGEISDRYQELPKDRLIVVYCSGST